MLIVVQVYQICLGTPPATFDWECKDSKDKYFCHANITPLQFYEQFVKPVFNMSDKVSPSQIPITRHVVFLNIYNYMYVLNWHVYVYVRLTGTVPSQVHGIASYPP